MCGYVWVLMIGDTHCSAVAVPRPQPTPPGTPEFLRAGQVLSKFAFLGSLPIHLQLGVCPLLQGRAGNRTPKYTISLPLKCCGGKAPSQESSQSTSPG